MNRRRPNPEPMLPLDFAQPIRSARIKPSVYDAIAALRSRGHVVWQAGRQHKVDGRIVSTAHLIELAEAVPCR